MNLFDPSSNQSLIRQAHLALQNGDNEEACKLAKDVLQHDSKSIPALLILAFCADPHESLLYLQQAEKIEAHNKSVQKAISWNEQRLWHQDAQPDPNEGMISSSSGGKENVKDDADEEITQPVMLQPYQITPDDQLQKEGEKEIQKLLANARWKSAFQVGSYLVSKALLILATIFTGVFITILIANRPFDMGFFVKPAPLESSIIQQIDTIIKVFSHNNPAYQEMSPADQEMAVKEMQDRLYKEMGLDLSYLPRNLNWTLKALKFNWGTLQNIATSSGKGFSFQPDTINQNDIVLQSLPNTILLAATANIFIFLWGIPLALFLSRKHGTWFDHLFTFLTPVFSIPSWVIGIVLIAIFAVWLKIMPVAGMYDIMRPENPFLYTLMVIKHMALPVAAIVLSLFFQLVYSWRTFFMIYSEEDYVTLGKAQGLAHRKLQNQYILRPSLSYIITTFTLMLVSFWQMTMA